MRVLIAMSGWQESQQLETCWGIRHTQAHNIANQLRDRQVEIVYCQVGSPYMTFEESKDYYSKLDVPTADHALVIEPIAFDERTFDWHWEPCYPDRDIPRKKIGKCPFYDALRAKVPGCIATITNGHCIGLGAEDVMFYDVPKKPDENIRVSQNSVFIGWAADANVFQSNQSKRPVHILLDHPHYIESQPDDTDMLVQSLVNAPVTISRFGKREEEHIDPLNYAPTERYGSRIPHLDVAEIHSKAHIFCVTHQESQGLSVLEAAMSGSLIVAREGHIKPMLLNGLVHVTYAERPDWNAILPQVDTARCRRIASAAYDRWNDIGQIVYDTFCNWFTTWP